MLESGASRYVNVAYRGGVWSEMSYKHLSPSQSCRIPIPLKSKERVWGIGFHQFGRLSKSQNGRQGVVALS
jgi:hypothetical protein